MTVASNFAPNNRTVTYTGSTLSASQGTDALGRPVTVLTIRLGNPSSALTVNLATGVLGWDPSGAVTDAAGVACSTTTVLESGASDLDF